MQDTVCSIADAVRSGSRSAREVVAEARAAFEALNPMLNAIVSADYEQALQCAEEVDARVTRGEDPGLLAGVPVVIKDLEHAAGFRTSKGSLLLEDAPASPADDEFVSRLRRAPAP